MNANLPDGVLLENVSCPNECPPDDVFVLSGKDILHGIPGVFNIYRCRHCGLERTNPRPTPGTVGAYYPADYGPYISDTTSWTKPTRVIKDLLRRFVGLNSRILPNVMPGRMLEIGCSSGNYMEQARSSGWTVDGIEFSSDAAAVARGKGFSVRTGAIELMTTTESKYDMITGWMVLEHLHEPVSTLRTLRNWIKPDGYLVVLVPSAESLSRRIFGSYNYDLQLPTHLFHYTPRTLSVVLENAGWKIEHVFWQRNCSTILNSFEYWATTCKHPSLAKLAKWVRVGIVSIPLRGLLSLLLGLTRQSGRIEVWARPLDTSRTS